MTTLHRPCTARSGFATITMLFSLALVGLAVVAIGGLVTLEVRRTRLVREESQLRQLLLAGGLFARQMANDSSAAQRATVTPVLPATLRDQTAALRITPLPSAQATQRVIEVHADLGNRHAAQVLTFANGPSGWRAVDARIVRQY